MTAVTAAPRAARHLTIVKVLVVEDERTLREALLRGLAEEGFAVDVAQDGAEADLLARVNEYDAVVLDVMLPVTSGFSLCQSWRADGIDVPILFLTARDAVGDRVQGLDLGADDYLVKPFAFDELLARVRALLRRTSAGSPAPVLRIADLEIDHARRQARRGGRELPLTAREFQLLEYLAHRRGQVVTRTALWEHVWESGREPDSNVVDVYVGYLRNKLGREPDLIETVRGAGYVLRDAPAGS